MLISSGRGRGKGSRKAQHDAVTLLNLRAQVIVGQLLQRPLRPGLLAREHKRSVDDLLVNEPKRFEVVLESVTDQNRVPVNELEKRIACLRCQPHSVVIKTHIE